MTLQIRTLEDTPRSTLFDCFADAFSDYVMPMRLTPEGFDGLLHRRGFDPRLSVGAFKRREGGEHLVGFHLFALETYDKQPLAYDVASGVRPDSRGQGLSQQLFRNARPALQAAGARGCVLEVIVGNDRAVRAYERTGFVVRRHYDCWQVAKSLELPHGQHRHYQVEVAQPGDWSNGVSTWLDETPAWQNSARCLERGAPGLQRITLAVEGEPCAVAWFADDSGEVPLLAVAPNHRRQGWAKVMLRELRQRTERPLRFFNITAGSPTGRLLQSLGAAVFVSQFEMIWTW